MGGGILVKKSCGGLKVPYKLMHLCDIDMLKLEPARLVKSPGMQDELQLLERVFIRLGLAETDEQLQVGEPAGHVDQVRIILPDT